LSRPTPASQPPTSALPRISWIKTRSRITWPAWCSRVSPPWQVSSAPIFSERALSQCASGWSL